MGESFRQRQERAQRQFLNQLDDIGWTVVTDYVNWNTPFTVQCPTGHEQDIVPKTFYSSCPECNPPMPRTGPKVSTRLDGSFGRGVGLGLYWHNET